MTNFAFEHCVYFEYVDFIVLVGFHPDVRGFQFFILTLQLRVLFLEATLSIQDRLDLFLFEVHSFFVDFLLQVQLVNGRPCHLVAILMVFHVLIQRLNCIFQVINNLIQLLNLVMSVVFCFGLLFNRIVSYS